MNLWQKTLMLIGAGALIFEAGCAIVYLKPSVKDHKTASHNECRNDSFVYLDKIDVHNGPATALYKKDWKEGESKLVELAKNRRREECFLFIDGNEPLWADVGDKGPIIVYEKPDGTKYESASISFNYGTISDILDKYQNGNEVTLVYYHPDKFFRGGEINLEQSYSKNLPSPADYIEQYILKTFLKEEKGISIKPSKVVGCLYTFEYDVNKEYNEKEIESIVRKTYKKIYDKVNFETIFEQIAAYEKAIDDCCNELKNYGIILKITNKNGEIIEGELIEEIKKDIKELNKRKGTGWGN